MAVKDPSEGCTVISGPFSLFDNSFVVEFLKPKKDFDASVLIKVTYKAGSPMLKLGKNHPQVPPYHLHWSQIETFQVLQGSFGVTTGWDRKDTILTPENTPHHIDRWVPHTVWPDVNTTATSSEDTIALLWAHPDVENSMDDVFFEHLFRYLDECHSQKKMPDLIQMLVSQHATDSTLVIAPGMSFLGPLRWGIPWVFQAGINFIGKALGYTPDMAKFMKDR